jgi:hypothetical protein
MTSPPARSAAQRKRDTLSRLEQDQDAWVATADPETGLAGLVPLSFLWDGSDIILSTVRSNPAGRNMQATGQVRLGIGLTRDVVLIEGSVRVTELDDQAKDAFAVKTGFDPREMRGYLYFRVRPLSVQAWREVNELKDRDLMADGEWLT